MESAPTKEAVLAGAAAKGLIPYLLDQRMAYSLGSDEDFLELVAGLVNDGSLPLRTEGDDRHMAGMAPALYFSGLSLVCKLIPRLEVDLEAMMKLVTTLVHHGGNDLCAGTPNTAFVSWCTRDKGRVDRVLAHARAGEALALSHLRSALVAGQRVVEAVEFLDSDHIKAVVEAASALGAMEMDDGGAQRSSEALVKVMADSDDENVLRLALLSFFRILDDHAEHPRKHARALLNVVGQRGSPEGKYALAQVLTHYGEDLTEEEVLIAVDGLKTIGPEDEGVIMQVDLASRKLGAGSDAKFGGLTNLVAKLIRQWQGRLTLEAFPTFWEQLISDGGRRLHRTVVEWLLDGNFWLCTSLSKMITGYTEPYRLDLVKGLLPNAGSDQIFLCRKATGFLFVSPITAASVLVSTLRHGDPDVAEDVAELLYDPLLVNYSGVLRAYLEGGRQDGQ